MFTRRCSYPILKLSQMMLREIHYQDLNPGLPNSEISTRDSVGPQGIFGNVQSNFFIAYTEGGVCGHPVGGDWRSWRKGQLPQQEFPSPQVSGGTLRETLVCLKIECTTKSPTRLRKSLFLQERGLEISYTNSRFSNERSSVCPIAFSIYDLNGMIFLSRVWAVYIQYVG